MRKRVKTTSLSSGLRQSRNGDRDERGEVSWVWTLEFPNYHFIPVARRDKPLKLTILANIFFLFKLGVWPAFVAPRLIFVHNL